MLTKNMSPMQVEAINAIDCFAASLPNVSNT